MAVAEFIEGHGGLWGASVLDPLAEFSKVNALTGNAPLLIDEPVQEPHNGQSSYDFARNILHSIGLL